MKHDFRIFIVLLLILYSTTLYSQELNIAFLNGRSNSGFWKDVEDFMKYVADDFPDITLTIYRADSNHLEQVRILSEITSPDYETKYNAVLTRTLKNNGIRLLEIAEKNEIPLFLFNSGLTDEQYAEVGGPRNKYNYFIGEMYPDDFAAGYDSAKELVRIAQENNIKTFKIVAMGGGPANNASVARVKGLEQYVDENSDKLELLQVIPVYDLNTQEEIIDDAERKTALFIERHIGPQLVWCYNDALSVGVNRSILKGNSFNLIPGVSFFSGGIDWTAEAITMIENEEMAYTLGGHYMDGGWALLAVYDYFNGNDFKDTEGVVTFKTKLSIINISNVNDYKMLFLNRMIENVDFKELSKTLNPALKTYSFSLESLLEQLK